MCGICGIVSPDRDYPVAESTLMAMRDSLTHRGPDDAGYYIAPGVGIGSRRLAILDLSENGHMPMTTPDRRFTIVHNGEVYNYSDLRSHLEARGVRFQSNSDTEVILHLYASQGTAMLSELNGMFAFAIWDDFEKQLFIARDRLGIKPLYYAVKDGALYFASEMKALFNAGIPREFEHGSWQELLIFRYVAGAATIFRGIQRLLPGHYMVWKHGTLRVARWWNLPDRIRERRALEPAKSNAWFSKMFDDAVNLRRISDVPVGVLLSGGLDSGSVAASLATQAGAGVASFTVGFDEPGFDESRLAKKVAEKYKLDYHSLKVERGDLLKLLHKASWYSDEPLVHASDVHLLAISQYAKPHVTVLLSGEGGDELLGGYLRYQPLRFPSTLKVLRPLLTKLTSAVTLNRRLQKMERFLRLGSMDDYLIFNSFDLLPNDLTALGFSEIPNLEHRHQVLQEAKSIYPHEPIRQAMYLDLQTYLCSLLDRNDRMTMGASIECRVPYLDYRLVEGIASMPSTTLLSNRQTKYLLRKAIGHRLPPEVLKTRKWGFGVPWSAYLRDVPDLRERVRDIYRIEPITNGPFDLRQLKVLAERFLQGDSSNEALILRLFMIATLEEAHRLNSIASSPNQQMKMLTE